MKVFKSNEKILYRIQCLFLALAIIAEPIYSLPERFQLPLLGGRLTDYFVALGIVVCVIDIIISKKKIPSKIKLFIVILISWSILTEVHGLWIYSYYNEINPEGSRKLNVIINFLQNHGMQDSMKIWLEAFWLGTRGLNNAIKELIYSFFVSVWVILLFKESYTKGFSTIRKYVTILAFILGIYAIPEFLLFKFNMQIGYDFLSITNPYLYDVGQYLDWYPPLIWPNNQLRSYCTEPSLFGFLAATIIPFSCSYFFRQFHYYKCVFFSYFIMLLFMTKSRTANAIVLFELFCATILAVFGKKWRKTSIGLILLIFLGFSTNIFLNFIPQFLTKNYTDNETFESYYNDNMKSIVDAQARSNGSRLINIKAHLYVSLDHPIMGVGHDLKDCYVRDKLSDDDLTNKEIHAITDSLNEKGPLGPVSYGNVNHYIYVLTYSGIIGLGLYLLPFIYVFYRLIKLRFWTDLSALTLAIALIGNLISQMAGAGMMLLYVVLGLLYIKVEMCQDTVSSNEEHIIL